MIADIQVEAAKIGLELHPSKTKILHNNIGYGSRVRSGKIQGMNIEVLGPTESTLYLGKALSLTTVHETELAHRLRKGWAKFGMNKQMLLDKLIPLSSRLKFFDAVITPTVLYGCSSWTMTASRDQTLNSTQLKMIRQMLGRQRLQQETYVEWIRRVTSEARRLMAAHGIANWTDLRKKRMIAWRVRLEGMAASRWSKRVFDWQPDGRRSRGHPVQRWKDEVEFPPLSPQGGVPTLGQGA